MKANAPEKIYIEVTTDGTRYYRDVVKEQRTENSDIEYTRTDAFIEKACYAYCKMYKMPNCKGEDCKYIKGFRKCFRNYMKGE